ncbi:MAG TPA: hypothetical protein VI728_11570 [Syntrophales bacterium]|nr:hypothetical protein [Syntrophales bacterium]
MAWNLTNLDGKTRELMIKEIDKDIADARLYMSSRFNELGRMQYPALLKTAVQSHDEIWLAQQIRLNVLMKTEEMRNAAKGPITAKVPITAPDTLAEGEFNRFYCRGVCLRAIEEGKAAVQVYRAKHVENPRPESEQKLGALINALQLLNDLRTSQGVEPALGIPPGPNSGLSIQLT